MSKALILLLPLEHEDERRAIREMPLSGFDLPLDKTLAVQSFAIKRGIPLGNHYHRDLEEVFITQSPCELRVQDINPETGVPIGAPEVHDVAAHSIVYVPRYTAHAFRFPNGGTMVCLCTCSMPDRKDVYPHKLMD